MICLIADVRGWPVEKTWETNVPHESFGAVRRIEENWKAFCKGGHATAEQVKEEKRNQKLIRHRSNRNITYVDSDDELELLEKR